MKTLRDRSWIGRKYGTQKRVDAEIARLERLASKWETMRDKQVWESPAYWDAHDRFIGYCEKIQELLP